MNDFDPSTLCMGCMNPLKPGEVFCPVCGSDRRAPKNAPGQLATPSILNGTYLVGRALGQGGFGITYIGFDLNLALRVAIKEYYPQGLVSRESTLRGTICPLTGERGEMFLKGRERFIEEARCLARFTSEPGVVNVRGFFQEHGTAYIVMDYVEGETLKQHAVHSGGRLPAGEALTLVQPVIRALFKVHAAGLLHRDISPDNIIIRNEDGQTVLLDFGAARQMSVSGEHSVTINVKHGYAPEEQYRKRGEQGPWSDVYALCATIYKLITGVTPPQAIDRVMADEPLAPPSQLGIRFDAGAEAALMKGLSVRGRDRQQSMAELYEGLYGHAIKLSGPAQSDRPNGLADARVTAEAADDDEGGALPEEKAEELRPAKREEPRAAQSAQPAAAQPAAGEEAGTPESAAEQPSGEARRAVAGRASKAGTKAGESAGEPAEKIGESAGARNSGGTDDKEKAKPRGLKPIAAVAAAAGGAVLLALILIFAIPSLSYGVGRAIGSGTLIGSAAKRGYADAQTEMGRAYSLGLYGLEPDALDASLSYMDAIERGSSDACRSLADEYYEGKHAIQKDIAEAVMYYVKLGEMGDAYGYLFAARIYMDGELKDEPGSAELAEEYLQRVIDGDFPEVDKISARKDIRRLPGQDAGESEGIEYDEELIEEVRTLFAQGQTDLAFDMLRAAAFAGDAAAQDELGYYYESGEYITKNDNEAAAWYRQSAEQGFAAGQRDLALCYSNGVGVKPDEDEAARLFALAAEQGDPIAQYWLGVCYGVGSGVVQDRGEAVRWYAESAEQGYAPAQYELGMSYLLGLGVEEDARLARELLEKAAAQGDEDAIQAIAELG